MSQERGFVRQAHAGNLVSVAPHFQNDFNYIVDVALGIDAAGNREADQIHLCRAREHQSADFYAANSAFQIKFGGERNSRELIRRNVREEGTGIQIDRMAAGRLDYGNALACDVIAEICGRGDAVAQVVLLTLPGCRRR